MKKAVVLLVLLVISTVSVFAFTHESEYSYTNIPLYKVYNHQNGYIVLYTKDGYKISTSYVPIKWFALSDRRGKLINLPKGLYPYMTIVYKNNEFQYVTLAVPRNPADSFWGLLPEGTDVTGKFDAETFVLQ